MGSKLRLNANVLCHFSFTLSNPEKATLDKTTKIFSEFGSENVVVTKVGSTKSVLLKLACAAVDSFVFSVHIPIYFTPSSDPWSLASVHPGKIIQIQKSTQSISEIHLDASFKLSPMNYKEMDGLIGDIGKKKYKFHSEVQSDGQIGSKSISIDIDNKLIKGKKVERNKEECWLINVDDILKPFKISEYLYKVMEDSENAIPNQ
ncbi:DgyrCDS14877 [Dimorphilus gyrociliatus]|uniref:DgyrCDS14877 n=1 Tax=Dimorphilus gyrociliatus TaxID=2664684 RepID=A0A7I8WF95_9ANNE|nr:DgyrCDS14877 [Dimorphilus gyrociliatus]